MKISTRDILPSSQPAVRRQRRARQPNPDQRIDLELTPQARNMLLLERYRPLIHAYEAVGRAATDRNQAKIRLAAKVWKRENGGNSK